MSLIPIPRRIQASFKGDGTVIPRDRRSTAKLRSEVREKANGGTLGDDPLAVYKRIAPRASMTRRRYGELQWCS